MDRVHRLVGLGLLAFAAGCAASAGTAPEEHRYPSATLGWKADTLDGVLVGAYAREDGSDMLVLHADGAYRRAESLGCADLTCAPTHTAGTYLRARTAGHRYLRLFDGAGVLVETLEYAFSAEGWPKLRATDDDGWVVYRPQFEAGCATEDCSLAGAFDAYDDDEDPPGHIYELVLEPNAVFRMDVNAVVGCDLPGHECFESWTDGYTGTTRLTGRWEAGESGVTLRARDYETGREAAPSTLTARLDGAALEVAGELDGLPLAATMNARVLFDGPRAIALETLAGTWTFVEDNRREGTYEGELPIITTVWGDNDVAHDGLDHALTFDAVSAAFAEISPNRNHRPVYGRCRVGADPARSGLGAVFLADGAGGRIQTLTIVELEGDRLVMRASNADTDFVLERR